MVKMLSFMSIAFFAGQRIIAFLPNNNMPFRLGELASYPRWFYMDNTHTSITTGAIVGAGMAYMRASIVPCKAVALLGMQVIIMSAHYRITVTKWLRALNHMLAGYTYVCCHLVRARRALLLFMRCGVGGSDPGYDVSGC